MSIQTAKLDDVVAIVETELRVNHVPDLPRRFGVNLWTGNLAGAVVCMGLGIFMVTSSLGFGFGTPAKPGAGVFPAAIGVLFIGLGAAWLLQGVAGKVKRESAGSVPDQRGWISMSVTVAVIVGFAALVDVLGYQLTMLGCALTLMVFVARAKWWLILIVALLFSFGTFALFDLALGVNLPTSSIPFIAKIGL